MHDHGMVKKAVDQGGGHDGIVEHVAPFGKATVEGQGHGTLFVARIDELEERIGHLE